jgi:hypothetical protein
MLSALVLATLVQVPSPTQELAPGTSYDPTIPTLVEIGGHDFREEVTPPDTRRCARTAPRSRLPDPEPDPDNSGTSAAEGVAVDAAGNIYGAEVGPRMLRKYIRQ